MTIEKAESIIPDSHLAVIGKIANWWAVLEFEVDHTSWTIAKVPHMYGACFTAQMISIHPKLNALRALCELVSIDKKLLAKLGSFQGDIGALVTARNRAVHDPRIVHKESGGVIRFEVTAPSKLSFEFKPEDTEKLEETAAKIATTIGEFQQLKTEILDAFRSSPSKPSRPLLDIEMGYEAPESQTNEK